MKILKESSSYIRTSVSASFDIISKDPLVIKWTSLPKDSYDYDVSSFIEKLEPLIEDECEDLPLSNTDEGFQEYTLSGTFTLEVDDEGNVISIDSSDYEIY